MNVDMGRSFLMEVAKNRPSGSDEAFRQGLRDLG